MRRNLVHGAKEEMKAYLGFCILMGINHLPALDDYWSTDPTRHYSPIADRITRDRFRAISRYLHFVDNDTLVQGGHLDTIGSERCDLCSITYHHDSQTSTIHTER